MEIIKTKSFELATISRGNRNSKNLAILLPGKLDTKDYANFVSHLNFLSTKGFYVIAIDPPGTWESPGSTELFNTTNYINAVNELIDYFGNKPTFLLGHSRGGQVAILTASTNPSIKGIAVINGSFDPPATPPKSDILNGEILSLRDLPPGNQQTLKKKKFLLPLNYIGDGEKYDARKALNLCKIPKLFFAGKDDTYYSPKDVNDIVSRAPEPTEFHIIPCGHDYRYYPEIITEINDAVGDFLDRYWPKL